MQRLAIKSLIKLAVSISSTVHKVISKFSAPASAKPRRNQAHLPGLCSPLPVSQADKTTSQV